MPDYTTPGVYIEELPQLPPSINSVETAIPVFIGYTQVAREQEEGDLTLRPKRISSLLEFERHFGRPAPERHIEVVIDASGVRAINHLPSPFRLYYSLELFFANGGGACFIVSAGNLLSNSISAAELSAALTRALEVNEVSLVLIPEAMNLPSANDYYALCNQLISECSRRGDRFALLDVYRSSQNWVDDIALFRTSLTGLPAELRNAAAYFPRILTRIKFNYEEDGVKVSGVPGVNDLAALKVTDAALYAQAKSAIESLSVLLPATPAIAGIFRDVDEVYGVWKAPANRNIHLAVAPELQLNSREQEGLNIDPVGGKSINLIRGFAGRGPAIVWGARTLAGNDNEWRYVSVRRFFIMVEESIKNATERFVFEPNDSKTWLRIKSMTTNFLTSLWRSGALVGATTTEAFFVRVGLNETMTPLDILEGRLIIEVGMAAVRPSEFIILRFSHRMQSEA